ncbi:MAG: hypothetical protein COV07_02820 [Candidatus Vogelbacteria bacterium CG10_big_fil_rev_8_21_14_0_10_45_14]|uniref:ComEC/Rec2-related protein domain-containing protein n=1 Tax=Candidatus Vogelbacteria bacterium CG10_big_fil_rev_8_21_14_0_10_45_14 TaxID=1975042 RepID=A0A2H0RJN3_9BACT|nr:MAG: hypothetical protein COV07_02820 [Candidatus Vogelbacteria bacterium CG10_big_fil_rev_8_21_14_0_10_45_14]
MKYAYLSVVGFFFGIAFRTNLDLGLSFSLFVLLIALAIGVSYFSYRSQVFLLTFCFLFFASLGMFRYDLADARALSGLDQYENKNATIVGVLREEPKVIGENQRLVLDVLEVKTEDADVPTPVRAKVQSDIPKYPRFKYGDRITITGKVEKPEDFTEEFSWVKFLEKDGILYVMYRPKVELIGEGEGIFVIRTLYLAKQNFLESLYARVSEPESALGAALTVGEKKAIGTELADMFRRVGLSHIIVLSGMHMAIVAFVIMLIFSRLPLAVAFSMSAVSIVLFAIMVGGGASVTRAVMMAIIAILARGTGRLYMASWALLLACALMLIWNPLLLVFDVGLQLSFLATAGIIWLMPIVESWLSRVPLARYFPSRIKDIMCVTISAQIAVMPLILYKMGNFSLVALPVNLVVLPIVPFAMGLVGLVGILGQILGVIVTPLSWFAYLFLTLIIRIATLFDSLPIVEIQNINFPLPLTFLSYATIVYFTFIWYKMKEESPIFAMKSLPNKNQITPKQSEIGDDFQIEYIK